MLLSILILSGLISAGYGQSYNLGTYPGLNIRDSLQTSKISIESFIDFSNKSESNSGWLIGLDIDYLFLSHISAGTGYHYRHDRFWTKSSLRSRLGLCVKNSRLVLILDHTSENRTKILEFQQRTRFSQIEIEPRIGYLTYLSPAGRKDGLYWSLNFGVRI